MRNETLAEKIINAIGTIQTVKDWPQHTIPNIAESVDEWKILSLHNPETNVKTAILNYGGHIIDTSTTEKDGTQICVAVPKQWIINGYDYRTQAYFDINEEIYRVEFLIPHQKPLLCYSVRTIEGEEGVDLTEVFRTHLKKYGKDLFWE